MDISETNTTNIINITNIEINNETGVHITDNPSNVNTDKEIPANPGNYIKCPKLQGLFAKIAKWFGERTKVNVTFDIAKVLGVLCLIFASVYQFDKHLNNLTPSNETEVVRLVQYIKQGMIYAAINKPEEALSEFQQGLAIDRNFPGLNQNAAASLLALKRYDEAKASLNNEFKLISRLERMKDADLQKYAYMLNVEEKSVLRHPEVQAETLRDHLGKIKAIAQYNLACLYSLRNEKQPALDALKKAIETGFDDKKTLASDPDLAFIRTAPEFVGILQKVK
jgi:tetratricopeptide (TPR) repeat protein